MLALAAVSVAGAVLIGVQIGNDATSGIVRRPISLPVVRAERPRAPSVDRRFELPPPVIAPAPVARPDAEAGGDLDIFSAPVPDYVPAGDAPREEPPLPIRDDGDDGADGAAALGLDPEPGEA